MTTELITHRKLLDEIAQLRARLEEAEEALNAIRTGQVDALVVEGASGPQLFTLQGVDAEKNRSRGEMLAQVSEAVIAFDLEQRVTYLNAAAERQYGISIAEALGRPLTEIYHERWSGLEDGSAPADIVRATGKWRGESIHVLPSGRMLPVESSLTVFRDGVQTGFLAVIRDITDRQQTEAELRENEHFLQRVIEVTPGVLSIFDLIEQRTVFINRSIASALNYSETEAESSGTELATSLMHADDLTRFDEHRQRVRTLADGEVADFDHRLRDSSGEWRWFHSRDAVFSRNESGEPRQIIGAMTEITDRVKAAEALERANLELTQMNRELDDFAYIASHDLKEPLRGIGNFSSLLLRDCGGMIDESGREKLVTLVSLTERMTGLIDALLHYSRVGRTECEKVSVDTGSVFQEVIDLLKPVMEQAGVQVRQAGPFPLVQSNLICVREIIQNLITNAMKYNDKPEKWIEIGIASPEQSISPKYASTRPTFYVRDNGIGIAPKHLDSIFAIFKRLHGRDKFGGGTGVGLTIVKKLVEMNGGRIWVESEPRVGSTFYFTL